MWAGGSFFITTNLFSQVVSKCHNHKYAVIQSSTLQHAYTQYKVDTTVHTQYIQTKPKSMVACLLEEGEHTCKYTVTVYSHKNNTHYSTITNTQYVDKKIFTLNT